MTHTQNNKSVNDNYPILVMSNIYKHDETSIYYKI